MGKTVAPLPTRSFPRPFPAHFLFFFNNLLFWACDVDEKWCGGGEVVGLCVCALGAQKITGEKKRVVTRAGRTTQQQHNNDNNMVMWGGVLRRYWVGWEAKTCFFFMFRYVVTI